MKRFLGFLFFSFFLCLGKGLATLKTVEIYPNGIFLTEEFPLKNGENLLPLLNQVKLSEIEFLGPKGRLEIIEISLDRAYPKSPLFKKLKDLEAQERALKRREQELARELTLLEKALSGNKEALTPAKFKEYLAIFEKLEAERAKVLDELSELERAIKDLRQKVRYEEVSALKVLVKGDGSLLVRYPAKDLFSFKDVYAVFLDTEEGNLRLRPGFVIRQLSGASLGPLEICFYPRPRSNATLSPPPFTPWVVSDSFLPPPGLLMKRAATVVEKLKAPSFEREVPKSGFWERLKLSNVYLSPGENVLSLPDQTLPVRQILVEVPLYAGPMAFFRVDLIPDKSLPKLSANLYLDGTFVGKTVVGPFLPGKENVLYFGQAHLIEVKREVLKDLSGNSFWGKKIEEKITRTTLINHYPRAVQLEVIDRLPITRKKEIKVEAKAEPQWDERKPNGKVIWRFRLGLEEKKTILLSIKIKRPKNSD